jgi:hypothetical protein
MNRLSKLAILMLMAAAPALASYITLGNNGLVIGAPGDTVGWDFTIVNNSAYWMVITGVQTFGETLPLGPGSLSGFENYADLNFGPEDTDGFFVILPNGGVWQQTFSVADFTGLGAYPIDPGVLPPAQDAGVFLVYYSLYDSEDQSNEVFNHVQLCTADLCTGDNAPSFEINVQGAAPEPGTVFLSGAALLLVFAKFRRRTNPIRA